MRILVLNGPNLNLIGLSGDKSYGDRTLVDINDELKTMAAAAGAQIEFLQSNHEGVLIDRLHSAILEDDCDAILFNPGPLRHTSLGLADAVPAFPGPVYEVHIQKKGEHEFRHPSIMKAVRQFCGPAEHIYRDALKALLKAMQGEQGEEGRDKG